eukprot:scaffold5263_cov101-Skeletonema_menzelii.AAC.1
MTTGRSHLILELSIWAIFAASSAARWVRRICCRQCGRHECSLSVRSVFAQCSRIAKMFLIQDLAGTRCACAVRVLFALHCTQHQPDIDVYVEMRVEVNAH